MNILIIGATGQVGQLTTDAALAAGHSVTAFGRSTDKIDAPRDRLSVFSGDVLKLADVREAMDGQDVVILTFGAPMNADTLLHEPDLCKDGTAHVVDAMADAGVKRLVCQTMIGVGNSKDHGRFIFRNLIRPVLLGRIAEDREAQEEIVRSSYTQWTIVRPTELNDDAQTGGYRVLEDLEGVTAKTIARADVAEFLVKVAEDDNTIGRTYLITQ